MISYHVLCVNDGWNIVGEDVGITGAECMVSMYAWTSLIPNIHYGYAISYTTESKNFEFQTFLRSEKFLINWTILSDDILFYFITETHYNLSF
jgi:hypothetical protein